MPSSHTQLLATRIDALSWEQAIGRIVRWAQAGGSHMVCLCNVHSLVTARRDAALARALADADLNSPDGAPLAWLMRRRGWPEQQRMSGPDMMWKLLGEAQHRQLPVFLIGGSPRTLDILVARLQASFPALTLAGQLSPPFRALSEDDNHAIAERVNASGARILLVGLGCPKQEKWMAAQRGRVHAVMVGVGAAFDYHAGVITRAPVAWQRAGFEWLYRLLQEPTRLASRYLLTNTLFLLALPRELWRRPSG
jgi:N-acetylglucosaminyldiphosphoundecaprenol N-acetyl-beta-D-mannosaminyltransferase